MLPTSPSAEIRVLLCRQCGAPVEVPDEGGSFPCSYCNSTLVVARRRIDAVRIVDPTLDPSLDPDAREHARLESLRAQAENYTEDNPYSFFNAPDDYEFLAGVNETDPTIPALAQQAFTAAVEACEDGGGSLPQQRAVFWVARKLKNIWTQRNDPMRARATIETAHEVVRDPGYIHMLRTALADLARSAGDLDGARAWLDRCDPRPELLDLDTSLRTSEAILALTLGDVDTALEWIGIDKGDIPYEPSSVAVVHSIRVAALERLGRPAEAEAELRWLIEDSIVPVNFLETMYEGSKNYEPCREVWSRIRAAESAAVPEPLRPPAMSPEPSPPPPAPKRRDPGIWVVWLAAAMVLAMAAIFASYFVLMP